MTTPTIQDVQAQGCELQLPAMFTSVGTARQFVIVTLRLWAVGSEVVDTAELIASELVTNAVERTRLLTPWMPGEVEPKPPDTAVVRVRVRRLGQAAMVEVWDADRTPPVVQEQCLDAERGRGLFLVASLCKDWGFCWPEDGGKIVWGHM